MFKALFLALNVRPNEEKQVLLLLGQGFFMGVFLATFQITAETLFLNRLSEYLKEAILCSGFLGIITTALFSYLQNRISFRTLALGNLALILLFVATIYASFHYGDPSYQEPLIFLSFALIGPILAVSLLGFWGTFGRLFDLRQSKRIIGGIDIGQLMAAIITSFSFPFLQTLIPETTNYLLISCVSIALSFIFLFILTSRYDLSKAELSTLEDEQMGTNLKSLAGNKYVRLLSTFLLFSMVTFTFIQFSFQDVVSIQYPGEDELRNFLAIFNGAILVLGLLLQTFVNDKIIGEYGLKVSLLILPLVLIFFLLGSIVSGEVYGFTKDSGTSFIWFFLFVALSRLFNFSLRDSLENPTFKLYFMPLDNRIRFDIQTKVEGVVNETSRFIAGALIIGLSYLSFIELIHYSYALIFLIAGYIYVVGKLYIEYKNNIKIKLEKQQRANADLALTLGQKLVQKLELSLKSTDPSKAIFSYKLLEKIEPQILPASINTLMGHKVSQVRDFAQNKMNELKGLSVSERYVISSNKSGGSSDKQVVSGTDLLTLFQSGDISKSRVSKLCKSDIAEDRQYAAELLGNSEDEDNISLLIELLHDIEPKVRYAAIKTAQRKYNNEVLLALIENLGDPVFSVQAASALTIIGGKALNALDSAFYKTGQQTQIMLKVVQIIGRIGGNKAKEILWSKMDFPDKVMVSQILFALGNCGFRAGISQIARIKYAIESDIEDIAWNISAIGEVSDEHFGKEIKKAIEEEIDYDVDHIYMLLSMLYESQSIQLVKENIESQTSEGVTYGVELLDIFLSEDLKQRFIPVIDDIAYPEKARKLEIFYPRERLENKMVLKFLLNRDFSQTNRWTKSCIIYQIGLLKIREFYFDLIANLFNPDLLIREMAAWSLYQIDPEAYDENVKRLGHSDRRMLDSLIKDPQQSNQKSLRFDKVMFLKKINVFENIIGLAIADLIDITEEVFIKEGETVTVDEHYNDNFYIVYKGAINLYENGEIKSETKVGEFIGEMVGAQNYLKSNLIIALTDTVLLKIKKDGFYDLLADNVKLANKMIEYV
ncbi:MAG: HEAT repeat domain-containing protein [Fulvivirga sp.]|uniref:HEAT repeat domain-containing protein n=2 Tax=Fulvivirga sp. TaxID=1931237 RepID=UPI0032EAE2A3